MQEFGIIITAFNRPLYLADVLKSLQQQDALQYTEVWIDGHQAVRELKLKTMQTYSVASRYPVKEIRAHRGSLGFRKMILQVMAYAVEHYKHFVILEDDCFPTRNAIDIFRNELKLIETSDEIFSVYGHPFLMPAETETISRFQGWGWGTTAKKMKPYLEKLIDCYSMLESDYLQFVDSVLTDEIVARLDITPPRQPTLTLRDFFAWDETLALLTALDGKLHKKTPQRTIYNFGASLDSSRFKEMERYTAPPFNMVSHEDIWKYY